MEVEAMADIYVPPVEAERTSVATVVR